MTSPARPARASAGLCCAVTVAVLAGCNTVGPASIAHGRAAYTDVITRTNDEQLLNTLVRLRYGETTTMLMVTAINAQVEVSVGTGVNAGVGPSNSYDGNLVPFSLEGSYRESPTISYEPLNGEKYLKDLVTPISLDLYGLLVDNAADTEWMLQLLTAGLAGLDNPVHYESPRAADLEEALALMARLRRAGVLSFAYRMDDDDTIVGVDLVLDSRTSETAEQAARLMALLRKPLPQGADDQVCLPLQMGRFATGPEALRLQTRSTLELLHLAARGVEVPGDQLQAGIAAPVSAASAQPFVQVRSSIEPPADPFVAVPYRGHWFWVESNDLSSKRGFVAMQMLLQSCLSDESDVSPQLTLPIH